MSSNQVTIFDESLDVDEGDSIVRNLPNGKAESYTVLEAHFRQPRGSFPASYKLTLRKDSSLVAREKAATTINISHSQGFQVGDHNVQNLVESFKVMVNAIDDADASEEEKQEAKGRLAKFLEHPLVCSVLGGAVGGLVGLLAKPG